MYKKHIVLGIGIGIFITCTVFFIAFKLYEYTVVDKLVSIDYEDEYIVERATEMGMIFFNMIDFQNNTNIDTAEDGNISVNESEFSYVNIPKDATAIEIAQIMENADLIDDTSSFTNYIIDANLQRNLRYGNFLIRKGSSFKELLDILTK